MPIADEGAMTLEIYIMRLWELTGEGILWLSRGKNPIKIISKFYEEFLCVVFLEIFSVPEVCKTQ